MCVGGVNGRQKREASVMKGLTSCQTDVMMKEVNGKLIRMAPVFTSDERWPGMTK